MFAQLASNHFHPAHVRSPPQSKRSFKYTIKMQNIHAAAKVSSSLYKYNVNHQVDSIKSHNTQHTPPHFRLIGALYLCVLMGRDCVSYYVCARNHVRHSFVLRPGQWFLPHRHSHTETWFRSLCRNHQCDM